MDYRFSIDDNIWFLKDIAEHRYHSIFENEYLNFYRYLHNTYHVKIQFNVFYSTEGFDLSQMPDTYKDEWKNNANWLKLSFHSLQENPPKPYEHASREEVKKDCKLVHNEIMRFAGPDSLDLFTTLHYVTATKNGCLGLKDCGIKGLVGLFGSPGHPSQSYYLPDEVGLYLNSHPYYKDHETGLFFFNNDMVINTVLKDDIPNLLKPRIGQDFIEIMIHEQYFYKSYYAYQPDYKEKVEAAISFLNSHGYQSVFLDEIADGKI